MPTQPVPKILTGIPEFDAVLKGGLPAGRTHLLEGTPGTGKTTIALQFLLEGARCGQRGLYVSLAESAEELHATAGSHGWSLDEIELFEVMPPGNFQDEGQSVLFPSDIGLSDTLRRITDRIAQSKPDRVVIDSVSELRLLVNDPQRYRRHIFALRQALSELKATTLLLSDLAEARDHDLQSMVHGAIELTMRERSYGAARRQLRIVKMRGAEFQSGWHDFMIVPGEVLVFPSLIAEEHHRDFEPGEVGSGVAELDALFGGGLSRGSATMLIGPSGIGKSSLALTFAFGAVRRRERAVCFSFDESTRNARERATGLGFDLDDALRDGRFVWERANPTRLSPGEFVWWVRRQVEQHDARMVIIDSLNSYLETLAEESALILQMHELLTYLANQGVVTIVVMAQRGTVGRVENPVDLSFLSDSIVLMNFFESRGYVRKAISVVKKRTGKHDAAIHEFQLGPDGFALGGELRAFDGVLTGEPRLVTDDRVLRSTPVPN